MPLSASVSRGLPTARISTGIEGVDDILDGGLAPNRLYLVEGSPGSGKTTLALQFLVAGRARGRRCLYVTLSETTEELTSVAASHGWSLEGIELFDLTSAENLLSPDREMTLLHPWELELGETIKAITDHAAACGAELVVLDSVSEMRLLAQEPFRFRRQVLALKKFFLERSTTVLLLDDLTSNEAQPDPQLHSLSHGVLTLQRRTVAFGAPRRRMEVVKMRAATFRGGWHDYTIRTGGLVVFPSLVAAEHHAAFAGEPVPSGLAQLDAMLAGGPLRGTSTLLTGPPGTGKSTLAILYLHAAAERGERSVMYEFDERLGTLLARAAQLGMDLAPHIESGLVTVVQVDPAQVSPGEFTHMVRQRVERDRARLLVIDSLNGYFTAMSEEKQLVLQVHELLSYLNQRGVLTFLINPQQGFLGNMQSDLNLSYLADSIVLFRYFEADGRVRKALSVIKNRGGGHEESIREYRIGSGGPRVGEPLSGFHGVLTGTPTYVAGSSPLLETQDEPGA